MTNRQFLAWQLWQREEWNRPSRTDHYLMNLTRAQVDGGDKKPLGEFRLRWGRDEKVELTDRQQRRLAIESKARSLDRSGLLTPELLADFERQLKELDERG